MMTWMRERWRGVAVIATAVLVTSALVVGGVLAQTPPTPTPNAPGKPGVARSAPMETFINKLAGRLGVTPDKLKTEVKNVQKEMVDEAVAAGRISKEAGDKLKERIDAGQPVFPRAGPGGPGRPGAPGKPGQPGRPGPLFPGLQVEMKAIADFLGMTPQELGQELRSGKSLAQVAQAKGKSRDELKAFLVNQAKTRLDKAVADGKLTRERADAMLKRFEQQVDQLIDRIFTPGQGPRGDRPGGPGAPKPGAPKPGGNA
jgi:hypothetical protein